MVSYQTLAQTVSTAAQKKTQVSFKNNNLEKFFEGFSSPAKKDNYCFFLGGIDSSASNNSNAGKRVWGDISLVRNIGRDEVYPVIERIDYKTNQIYDPWISTGNAVDDNYYVYNQQNGIVYLCISSNTKNRSDLFRSSNSTKIPVHTVGYQSYDDGYTWLALYKIDPSLAGFLTDSLMPVPDVLLDYQEYSNSVGFANRYDTICPAGGGGSTGCCCTYAKEEEQKWPDNGVYSVGDFIDCFNEVPNCFTCQMYGEILKREVIFATGGCQNCSDTVTVKPIAEKIRESRPNQNSNLSIQSDIKQNAQSSNGQIVSAFINLSSVPLPNRVVTSPEPKITVASETGSGADIVFTTYRGTDKNYYVDGIKIYNRGTGYSEDYVLKLTDATTQNATALLGAVSINLDDVEDGVADSPRKLLNVSKILFNISIRDNEISNYINQKTFTRYGIIKNPQNSDGTVLGRNKNVSEKITKSNLVELVVRKKDNTAITSGESIPIGSQVLSASAIQTEEDARRGKVVYFKVRDADPTRADVSISSSNAYIFASSNPFSAISNDGVKETFIVTSYTLPTLTQNTGNLLFSNETNIDIPTTASSARPTRNYRFKFVLEQ